MTDVRASAERELAAVPQAVFDYLSDYRDRRPRIITENYRDYRVEQGGEGAGTVIAYRFAAGRRERDYTLAVEVPEPGRILRERDTRSSFETTWTVEPAAGGRTHVTVTSAWQGAGGVAGFFERTFAPLGLRRIYTDVLNRLAVELGSP